MRISDWSSDVCSSDLLRAGLRAGARRLRDAGTARRRQVDDDRQPDPGPVRCRAQLALRRGAGVLAARHRAARHDALPAALPARSGGAVMRVDVGNPLWRFRGICAATWLFFAYLYLPIVVLIVLSFNENRLATIWSGFSTQWYGEIGRAH